MPFIQRALGDVAVIPLVAGDATRDEVADVLNALWGGPETLLVISTDLSHYLSDDAARRIDAATVARIAALDGPIGHEYACGATPLNGLLVAARRRGLTPHCSILATRQTRQATLTASSAIAAFAFRRPPCLTSDTPPAPTQGLPSDAGKILIPLARAAIRAALGESLPTPTPSSRGSWRRERASSP